MKTSEETKMKKPQKTLKKMKTEKTYPSYWARPSAVRSLARLAKLRHFAAKSGKWGFRLKASSRRTR